MGFRALPCCCGVLGVCFGVECLLVLVKVYTRVLIEK